MTPSNLTNDGDAHILARLWNWFVKNIGKKCRRQMPTVSILMNIVNFVPPA